MYHEWYHNTKNETMYNNKGTEMIKYFSKEITYHNLQCDIDSKVKTKAIPQRATLIKQRNNNFTCYPQHDLEATPSTVSITLKRHINNLPEWKIFLIQSATEINTNEPLMELIQGKRDIIIVSDGSKATTKFGGAWVFTNYRGNILVQSHNPDFTLSQSRNIWPIRSTHLCRRILQILLCKNRIQHSIPL